MGRLSRERTVEERLQTALSGPNQDLDRGQSGSLPRVEGRSDRRPTEQLIRLDDIEMASLTDIGTFRAVTLSDLTHYRFDRNEEGALKTMNRLARHGLIEYRTLSPGSQRYVTLTPEGRNVLKGQRPNIAPRQQFYCGFVKPREARHDAAIYRLYQQEAAKISTAGGRVTRVVLDFELKRSINRRLSTLGRLPQDQQEQRRLEIAEQNGLKAVHGKIPLPDLRLEYEGPDHDQTKVDLELVTSHYHRGSLAAKARAGFAMYALPEDAVRLRPAIEDPEIMQDILSL